ncbi:TetR/AcrR family transcriptional regulator [Oceanibacterium hippocampi]|uniref:HTH-type transcriptional repressor NicS n=1 Tax=Oceanibacterium hippocampi TaxID=745714 RepID=A0A1Y5RY27_9PROT|nr:TetR/AcrR family transcriptional regulator [Oceanibacterium hippocampi]SLN27878.1 HTH-type transcriptional repressor NicS [Oceanibacterium hippocampi]
MSEQIGDATRTVVRRDPERTRELILNAAIGEFSAKGLGGARVDEIAERSGVNKRMIYHYFGNKDGLFLAVLETVYKQIRASEAELNLKGLSPEEGMRKLAAFTWQHYLENPEFISLLNSENLHKAVHLRQSTRIRELHSPLVDTISDLLRRGEASGAFRKGVDPVQLYISIASLGYFYLSNIHTLTTIFGRNLRARSEMSARQEHVVEVIMSYLRPGSATGD